MNRSLRDRLDELYKNERIVGLSAEESRQLPDFLEDPDLKFRFFVGDLILRNWSHSLVSLLPMTRSESDEIRRSAVYLLGRIGRGMRDERRKEVANAVLGGISDSDPKVRRNAAIALGALGSFESVKAIAEKLAEEQVEWVRPSLILALGQIGGAEGTDALSTVEAKSELETGALEKARDRTGSFSGDVRFAVSEFDSMRKIELRSAPGLEATLCEELKTKIGVKGKVIQTGAVEVALQDLASLYRVRGYREWLIPIGERTLADNGEGALNKYGLELLKAGLETLTDLGDSSGPIRYRIEVRGRETKHDSRRRLISGWVKALDREFPQTTNSPSHYGVELRLQRAKTQVALFVKIMHGQDDRFDYRVADVPAAMHPATAAGVIRLAPRLNRSSRVLDPFCGSGTLLFERAMLDAPVADLVGVDISGNANTAARLNLGGFNKDGITFQRGDMGKISLEGRFDELISNLPYGIKTGSHKENIDVYRILFDRLPEWLNNGASVTLVTQELELAKTMFAESRHLRLRHTYRIDTGGLQPGVFVGSFSA